jgi:hypothetical protein
MEIEEKAWEPSSEIDGRVIRRLLIAQKDDDELKRFFDVVPGFCRSRLNEESLPSHVRRSSNKRYMNSCAALSHPILSPNPSRAIDSSLA